MLLFVRKGNRMKTSIITANVLLGWLISLSHIEAAIEDDLFRIFLKRVGIADSSFLL